jgi:phosphopantothenoylcysteine decarboxylase/phosphopantothenate--cysteine ligase
VKRIDVESAADMLNGVQKNLDGVDIFIATAAVADYRPANAVESKIKKTSESMDLKMERTVDILATVAARVGGARPFVVGFAAETDSVEQYARQKLLKKNLDMIAANEVGHDKVFEKDDNALLVLWRDGRQDLPHAPKVALARDLVALIADRYAERKSGARLASIPA